MVASARSSQVITIRLNGKPREIEALQTISALLDSLNISGRQVAVAINGEVMTRDLWSVTLVAGGDVVEIVRAVGGG